MKETNEVGEKVDVLYFSFSKNGKSVIIKVSEGSFTWNWSRCSYNYMHSGALRRS